MWENKGFFLVLFAPSLCALRFNYFSNCKARKVFRKERKAKGLLLLFELRKKAKILDLPG